MNEVVTDHLLPAVAQGEWDVMSHSPIHNETLMAPALCRYHAEIQKLLWIDGCNAMSYPEDSIPQPSSLTSGSSCILSTLSSTLFLNVRGNGNIPFRNRHSTVILSTLISHESLHCHHPLQTGPSPTKVNTLAVW